MKYYIGLGVSPHDTSLSILNSNGSLEYAEAAERPLQLKRAWSCVPDHIGHIEKLMDMYCADAEELVLCSTWSRSQALRCRLLLPYLKYRIKKYENDNRKELAMLHSYVTKAHLSVMNFSQSGIETAYRNKNIAIRKKYFEHHMTHAATAAYASDYGQGVCVVIDGFGESGSIDAYKYSDNRLDKVHAVRSAKASLGFFYAFMCDICGFSSLKGEEWKVMGLAAYGKFDQKIYDLVRPLLSVKGTTLEYGKNTSANTQELFRIRRKPETSPIEFADFSATVQHVFCETLIELLNNIYELGISDNLILSGGCALNSSANGIILENTKFANLFVNSAPADDGNCVGAAVLGYFSDNPNVGKGRSGILSPYLGSQIESKKVAQLERYSSVKSIRLEEAELCREVAKRLAEGAIVGWAQGKAEFGPRALGNRSILADPRNKDMKERINAEVKFREEFRPFAPSILHDFGEQYFENYQYSPYMERTLKFKKNIMHMVEGVAHQDGTGRLQSVTREINPRYYMLINEFYKITGVPILLNTSFNVMGKPIVHSVEDAVAVFQTSGLDLLVLNDTIFIKDS